MSERQSSGKRERDEEPAFQFIKQYVKEGRAKEWEKLLRTRRVGSLRDLSEFLRELTPDETNLYQSDLETSTVKIYVAVGKKIAGDTARQTKSLADEWLSFAARLPTTSAIPIATALFSKNRNPPILVMGSSGSGKSTFAVNVLPSILKKLDTSRNMFFVYMLGSLAFEERQLHTAEEAGNAIYARIKKRLDGMSGNDAMELTMVVVIDEVGIKEDAQYLGSRAKLDSIQEKLSGLAKNVQLVMVGTGLDRIASFLNSDQDVFKVRMTPWSRDLVDKYINLIYSPERGDALKDLIWSTHLYRKLSSNPRSLRFLTAVLDDQLILYGPDAVNEDFVVAQVTDKYIRANRLADLDPDERRVVAMIVWKALSEAEKGDAKLPDLKVPKECKCGDVGAPGLEACCFCLLDIHLETKGDTIGLVKDHDYAISITSALSLVLVTLTGNVAWLCSNWDQFELVAALHELQVSYVQKYPEAPPPIKILVSRALFPGKEKDSVRIPCVEANRIVVNGPEAQYCDVMSVDRLVQARYVEDPNDAANIDLVDELGKAGVLKAKPGESSTMEKQTLTTALLRRQWDGHPTGEQYGGKLSKPEKPLPYIPNGTTRHGSAVSELCAYAHEPRVRFYCEAISQSECIENQKRPVSVVFITNATRFKILKLEGGLDIHRRNVDKDGTLLLGGQASKYIQKCIDSLILPHVSVKFYFLQQDAN